jgi:hypothetical protein
MSEIDQGGFVYPIGEVNHSGPDKYPVYEGITLRQHYAGLAMQAIISAWHGHESCTYINVREVAIQSYEMADAMIEAGKQ